MFSLRTVLLGLAILGLADGKKTKNTEKKYVAEGYIVFDKAALDLYLAENPATARKDILHDGDYFFTFINEIYKSLLPYGLDLQIKIRKMEVIEDEIFPPSVYSDEGQVSGGKGLKLFENWLNANGARDRLHYDFAFLYTGVKLSGANGISYAGTICKPKDDPVGIATFKSMASARTVAHELGHIFGASHDGMAGYHVMRYVRSSDHQEVFTFSECSAFDIRQNIEKNGDKCLLQTQAKSYRPNVTPKTYKGKLQDPDALCKRLYGKESFTCTDEWAYKGRLPVEDMPCSRIYCFEPETNDCNMVEASEGMTCGKDKICHFGKCIEDPYGIAADVPDIPMCSFGDQSSFVGDLKSCQEIFDSEGGAACDGWLKYKCCQSCDRLKKTSKVPGCYADATNMKVPDGSQMSCEEYIAQVGAGEACSNSLFRERCCEACHNAKLFDDCYGDSRTVGVKNEGDLPCEDAIEAVGERALCTDSYGFRRCCKTCTDRRGDDSCPYEQRGVNFDIGFYHCRDLDDWDCDDEGVAETCCKRCANHVEKRSVSITAS